MLTISFVCMAVVSYVLGITRGYELCEQDERTAKEFIDKIFGGRL